MTNVPLLNLTHSNRPILILKVGDDFWKGASLGPGNKKISIFTTTILIALALWEILSLRRMMGDKI